MQNEAAASRMGHYRLLERIGAGAMGEVWLAEDTRLRRPVALKRLVAASAEDAAAAERLLREARVASALSHPNVAVVYEVGEGGGETGSGAFIAMEYVRGHTLAKMLEDGPLDVPTAIRVARQVAEALADAHDRGIVHRDLKPGNVMLTERGLVKVLDFGLARFAPVAGEDAATWSAPDGALGQGALVGTLAYMAPEQARGRPVDGRADVYALGVLIYELISGRRPFQGANAVELLEAILRDPAPPLPAGDSPFGAGLAALVAHMLEKDPARRPAGMREVLADLEAVAAGALPAADAGSDQPVAVLGFENITRNPEDDWLGTGIAETVSIGLLEAGGVTILSRDRILEAQRSLGGAAHAGDPTLPARLGRELGAKWVVSGGYQCLRDQVRITVSVTDVSARRVTLNLKLDGTRHTIFETQDRLVSELVAGLQGHLGPQPSARAEETKSLEAYEALSKGLVNYGTETREGLDRAILFFERATVLDPGYARAFMHLGGALDLKGDYLSMPELCARGLSAIDRALELRPECAEGWRLRGSALVSLGRDEEALRAFERALILNPTEAAAYSGIARVHFILRGDFAGAVAAYEKALALNPQAGWAALQLAHCAALMGDFARAEASARRAVALQREFLSGRTGLVIVGAHVRLAQAFALQGRHAEALAELDHELEFLREQDHSLRGRIFIELHQRRGEAQLHLGDAEAARASLELALETFERRVRSGADDPATRYYAACAHALRGDPDAALTCLEKAAEGRPRLTAARALVEPALASLRELPRFAALIARARPAA